MKIKEEHIIYYIESQVENNEKIKIENYYMSIENIQVYYTKIDDNYNPMVEECVNGFTVLTKNFNFLKIVTKDILKFIRQQKINEITDEIN